MSVTVIDSHSKYPEQMTAFKPGLYAFMIQQNDDTRHREIIWKWFKPAKRLPAIERIIPYPHDHNVSIAIIGVREIDTEEKMIRCVNSYERRWTR